MQRRSFLASVPLLPGVLGAAADPQYVSIFDGRTLSGWSIREGPESAFYVKDGAIVIHEGSNYPAWLRWDRRIENFDFQCEFFIRGWSDGGIYIHAPEHGRNEWVGMKVHLFQKHDPKPLAESVGSIFPVAPPLKINVRNQGEWNTLRVLMDWPTLRVWINGEVVQDLNVETVAELKHRLRSGYLGIESLSYPLRFRNLRIRELPSKERWLVLYDGPEDLAANWTPLDSKAKWEALGPVLRGDGNGNLATREKFRDFELQMYIRGSRHHNGGIIFRGNSTVSEEHYEIQLHDVPGAVYPTGSLYYFRRAKPYPAIEAEKWYPFQLLVKGRDCVVRINGDTVVDYHELERNEEAPIMLQAHANNRWIEYKQIRVRRV
ncbi:MAG: DUF1080 domain-containing protein [Acidobacteria bacterium]|nr:DUF1080 domain-containing protein [Acidobacteriota bacterium]MBI3279512.1 DUF1080 domain-containing protein [Acidobacteriota bacterium]